LPETTLERLKRTLDLEARSEDLLPLSVDFYSRLAAYSQKLKRSAGFGNSEIVVRLVNIQLGMIRSMSHDLVLTRTAKAAKRGTFIQLLPEERYVCSMEERFQRRLDAFVEAVSSGQPSFVEMAQRSESGRSVVVRFTKHVDELVGLDLRRYGPFDVDDVASIPAASAGILIAGGEAVEVYTREEA
jgi:DNA replication factor GINS